MRLEECYYRFCECVQRELFEPYKNQYINVATVFDNVEKIRDNEYYDYAKEYLRTHDWENLFSPKFFGIIAIQVLAAKDRQNGDQLTAQAYIPRLCQLLGCDYNYISSQFSKNRHQGKCNQIQLYEHFKHWCDVNDFCFYLPKQGSGQRNNYVQYPISLALLDQEDRRQLGDYFHKCGLCEDDELEPEGFFECIDGQQFPPRLQRKVDKNSQDGKDLFQVIKNQIYSVFLSWDGTYSIEAERGQTNKRCIPNKFIIFWDKNLPDVPELFCNDKACNFSNGPKGEINFYLRDKINFNDWELTRRGNLRGVEDDVLAVSAVSDQDLGKIGVLYTFPTETLRFYYLPKDKIQEYCQSINLPIVNEPYVRLIGGVLLERESKEDVFRTWMYAAGPMIESRNLLEHSEATLFRLNSDGEKTEVKRVSLNDASALVLLGEGRYLLKYAACVPAIKFRILEPLPAEEPLLCKGWKKHTDGTFDFSSTNGEDSEVHGLDFSHLPELLVCEPSLNESSLDEPPPDEPLEVAELNLPVCKDLSDVPISEASKSSVSTGDSIKTKARRITRRLPRQWMNEVKGAKMEKMNSSSFFYPLERIGHGKKADKILADQDSRDAFCDEVNASLYQPKGFMRKSLDWLRINLEKKPIARTNDIRTGIFLAHVLGNTTYCLCQPSPCWISFDQFWEEALKHIWESAHKSQGEWHFLLIENFNIALPECWGAPLWNLLENKVMHLPLAEEGKDTLPKNLRIIVSQASVEGECALGLPTQVAERLPEINVDYDWDQGFDNNGIKWNWTAFTEYIEVKENGCRLAVNEDYYYPVQ